MKKNSPKKPPRFAEWILNRILDENISYSASGDIEEAFYTVQARCGRSTQQFGRRIALNTPIQGTAADLMKKAMIDIGQDIKNHGLGAKMILQVHDELVFEVPKSEVEKTETLVKEKMENVYPLRVPLKVHLGWGANWAEAK